jgi:tRNA modification GTPase
MNQLMQQAARDAVNRAELILRCVPIDGESPPSLRRDEVLVRTKCDLISKPGQSAAPARVANDNVSASAFTGVGLDELKSLIAQRLAGRAVSLSADALALRPRHEAALRSAAENLGEAITLIEPQHTERHLTDPELIASSLRAALNDLAALAGDITPDEVLGRVFATFCVGK